MNGAHRLYVASPDAERLERLFAYDPGFFVVGATGDGQQALKETAGLCPDAILLDSVLMGLDGAEALRRLSRMVTPPRVLFLCRTGAPDGAAQPDERCLYPSDGDAALLSRARLAAERPLPMLARAWEQARFDAAEQLLDRLGVSKRLTGRAYMQWAAAALACAPQLGESYGDKLYPFVAEEWDTTPPAVERAIRTAVEDTWLNGDLEAIQALFGFSVDAERGKPTNAEFLSMLAEHARRQTERYILDHS